MRIRRDARLPHSGVGAEVVVVVVEAVVEAEAAIKVNGMGQSGVWVW
jgi:hypothetical protein